MKRFRIFAFTATAVTYFLIFVGGLVRVSGAGLGCPDWPTCFGRWFPPTDITQLPPDIDPAQFNFVLAWIEYINRLIGVAVGGFIAVTAVWAVIKFRAFPRIVVPAVLAGVLVAYQGWQGGQMIAAHLESYLVSIHMGLAFIIAVLMTYLTQQAYYVERDAKPAEPAPIGSPRLWLTGLLVVSVAQVFLGTQVRTALEQVAGQYPLLPQAQWLKHAGMIGTVHAILGVVVTLLTWRVGATILKRVRGRASETFRITRVLIVLATAQVIIGGILYFAGIPALAELFHLLLSALYISALILLISALRYESVSATSPAFMSRLRWAIPILAFIVFIGVTVNWAADTARGELPVLGDIPEFEMTDQNGQSFGRDDLIGTVTIVDFFFTSCPGICPRLNGNMAELYHTLDSDRLQFVSISVDPENDTQEALKVYAESWDVDDDRWIFLRDTLPDVVDLCENGFMLPADRLPMGHTTRFTLVDPRARIRGYYDGLDQASIKIMLGHLRLLGEEFE